MRLHRFYIEEKLAGKKEIRISDGKLLHQLRDVFRLEKRDEVIFFGGEGMDIIFKIESLSKKEGIFVKEKEEESAGQRDVRRPYITLCMALIKKGNFELVLQKCTELGVSRFVPILAERSEKKNIDIERAKRIIKEASEQCGRGDLPVIEEIKTLGEVLGTERDLIVLDVSGEPLKAHKLTSSQAYKLLVGPEGGWSEKELSLFKEKNIPIYSLGTLTLRAETAAIAASGFALF